MLALAVGCDVQCRFTAVYAVSLAKRGFTSPRGLFEGPKGTEQIFAQSIQVDWEDRSSVPQGPGLGFAPDPSVIRTYLRAWTEGWQLSNFRSKFDAQIWIGQGGGHEATGRWYWQYLSISVRKQCIRPSRLCPQD